MFDFSKLNLGVDGDSITAGEQWSYHVYKDLGFASHHNVAVGSSVWYKRKFTKNGVTVETQDYNSPDFAGISDGWEPTDDMDEMQKRMNNCAVVHIQKFIAEVKSGAYPAPDVFVFAMGTNDEAQFIGNAEFALEGKDADINNTYTEAGAMRWCIQTIMTEYPTARVFVCSPIQTGMPNHNRKVEYSIENMKKICGGMAVQFIDCFHNSGICEKFEIEGGTGRYLKDGLHPDVPGQTLEGKYIGKEIRNNMF
ncbi:MAG: SGNH/GDSL hydrolase family protein [Oscillospiraceae bacterium]